MFFVVSGITKKTQIRKAASKIA